MEFFAAANTRNGFESIFDECFGGLDRIYILKGSSGCGKSTLMRRVASRAAEKGMEVDIIRCSADSESLDGVIIKDINAAIADGTSPHIMDVKYPCVRESIINLGQFWDEKKLLPHREEIISLTDRKSQKYADAYRSLSALGTVNDLKRGLILPAIDRERLDKCIFSFADRHNCEKGRKRTIFTSANTADGKKILPCFEDINTLYRVCGCGGEEYMRSLVRLLDERGCGFIASCSPTDSAFYDAVFLEEDKTLVTTLAIPPCRSYKNERNINTRRFTDVSKLAECKARMKTLTNLAIALEEDAFQSLKEAKILHSELESVYIPAMNFDLLDEYTECFIKSLLSV
ncbi:MAG: hypothetical protein E7595_05530 [Ruminococcaceae bacterium]|nr:hypothetical protein [Oscillospiraceae bacterium]